MKRKIKFQCPTTAFSRIHEDDDYPFEFETRKWKSSLWFSEKDGKIAGEVVVKAFCPTCNYCCKRIFSFLDIFNILMDTSDEV